jgi:hypothetical protein
MRKLNPVQRLHPEIYRRIRIGLGLGKHLLIEPPSQIPLQLILKPLLIRQQLPIVLRRVALSLTLRQLHTVLNKVIEGRFDSELVVAFDQGDFDFREPAEGVDEFTDGVAVTNLVFFLAVGLAGEGFYEL